LASSSAQHAARGTPIAEAEGRTQRHKGEELARALEVIYHVSPRPPPPPPPRTPGMRDEDREQAARSGYLNEVSSKVETRGGREAVQGASTPPQLRHALEHANSPAVHEGAQAAHDGAFQDNDGAQQAPPSHPFPRKVSSGPHLAPGGGVSSPPSFRSEPRELHGGAISGISQISASRSLRGGLGITPAKKARGGERETRGDRVGGGGGAKRGRSQGREERHRARESRNR
jgi:hypothetical protein